jgi:hypothetical protein
VRRLRTAIAVGLLLAGAFPPAAGASPASPTAADAELASRYAPIVMLKQQTAACDASGEQFVPSPVDIVLGNPDVVLVRGPSSGQSGFKTLATGPTSADIAGLGPSYYLDLPGNPIEPGCTYETASKALMQGREPTTYAHIAQEPGVAGIALQYWFFYYFNQFNDVHEGDWEMIQLAWDGAASVDEALARSPDRIALAQHGGGELATWADPKLIREGDHPVVYPASGSHATYYGAELYLGTGQNGSGFGCDDSTAPSRRVPLTAVTVPDAPAVDGPFGWLTYEGKWGQYEPALNNGPDGALQHGQWREPFRWMDGLRTDSPTVPGGATFGPSVTGSFCTVIAKGSLFYNRVSHSPWIILVILGVVGLLAWAAVRHTVWSPAPRQPLDQSRRGGQILAASLSLYRARWVTFLALGAVFVPIAIASAVLQHYLFESTGLKALLDSAASPRTSALVAVIVGSFGTVLAYTIVVALVAAGLGERLHDRPAGVRHSTRALLRHLWSLVGAQIRVTIALIALSLTIIGVPLAVKKAVDWAFTPYEVTIPARRARAALRSSTALVRGTWFPTAGFTIGLVGLTLTLGPVVGYLLIFMTSAPLELINVFGSLVYALVVPYTAIALGLLWIDLHHRGAPATLGGSVSSTGDD